MRDCGETDTTTTAFRFEPLKCDINSTERVLMLFTHHYITMVAKQSEFATGGTDRTRKIGFQDPGYRMSTNLKTAV